MLLKPTPFYSYKVAGIGVAPLWAEVRAIPGAEAREPPGLTRHVACITGITAASAAVAALTSAAAAAAAAHRAVAVAHDATDHVAAADAGVAVGMGPVRAGGRRGSFTFAVETTDPSVAAIRTVDRYVYGAWASNIVVAESTRVWTWNPEGCW
ncbi:hypothetical protein INS49_009111 [Diaporthe citri]|uniref:uncharacterized protein n=1 Tax=Diaporthe citri TaxID=83186 RepID=UPI001C7F4206|nr:uncharacterized protein INS49_009111 [Diaporthe citri]KAG6364008.1 hypothetical protein INS49_009111 [Diaporthe citri]